jgi:hypothetical protein
LQLLLKLDLMCNLLFFFNQVKTLGEDWVVFVFVLPSLHQDFNHILDPVANRAFVQDSTESFKDGRIGFWGVFGKVCAYFSHEANSDFDGVVGRSFKKKDQDLESNDFMSDGLIDKMSNESRC